MNKTVFEKPALAPIWQHIRRKNLAEAEELLRSRENYCVAACSRFLNRSKTKDKVWLLKNKEEKPLAIIVYSMLNLMPVFCGQKEIPPQKFLRNFFSLLPVHSVQGLLDDVIILEKSLEALGMKNSEKIDYNLMYLDKLPADINFTLGNKDDLKKIRWPQGLVLRVPKYTDMDELAVLQAGYEKEEVLPKGAEFNPAVSRLNMEKLLKNQQVLAAELNGRLVGKINTSGVSFTRFQVGGVYVEPNYRGLGIAQCMTHAFVKSLLLQQKGISLFVRKSNTAANTVYRKLGFEFLADYRISYYQEYEKN